MNPRRLYRSRSERAIAGIAGGMAEYLEVDPTVVRILWILAGIFTGGAILILYIILAFVIPLNPFQGGPMPAGAGYSASGYQGTGYAAPGAAGTQGWGQPGAGSGAAYAAPGAASPAWSPDWNSGWEAQRAARAERPGRAGLIIGTVLIVIGVIALADVAIPGWVGGAIFGPAIILAIGAALLVASVRRNDEARASAPAASASPSAGSTFTAPAPAGTSTPDAAAFTGTAPVAGTAPADAAATADWDPDATSSIQLGTETDRS